VRWIPDTSAWSRRGLPTIAQQIQEILDEDAESELVLTLPVAVEVLRGPQGEAVAAERAALDAAMSRLEINDEIAAAALDAQVRLASHDAESHRIPLSDLLTAASAVHHGCGVIHIDGDFELLAQHGGLEFEHRRLVLPDSVSTPVSPAAKQRELRRELARLLHQLPIDEAEQLLERAVRDVRSVVDR
jgi:predicted nucleic acid-binding protein